MDRIARTAGIFDGVAAEYDEFRLPTPKRVPSLLTRMLGRRPRLVVDLGSGTGSVALKAAEVVGQTGNVVGVDLSEEMVDVARRRLGKTGPGNLTLQQGRGESIPAPDNS